MVGEDRISVGMAVSGAEKGMAGSVPSKRYLKGFRVCVGETSGLGLGIQANARIRQSPSSEAEPIRIGGMKGL